MEAVYMTYEKNVFIQFEKFLIEGEIIVKDKSNKIVHKQKVKNKNFVMLELKEDINRLSIEIVDKTDNKVVKLF